MAEIAEANLAVLRRCFPVAMPGANFLSGGQSLGDAAARLSAMNRLKGLTPWNLSFSWSAALQMPLFELCRGTGELLLGHWSNIPRRRFPSSRMAETISVQLAAAAFLASFIRLPKPGK